MTPVEQVQEWLTAIGETTYDAEHRERLMWEELRELQAAMDEYHQWDRTMVDGLPEASNQFLAAKLAVARELCDLAYVAIGTAILRYGESTVIHSLKPPVGNPESLDRQFIEQGLYNLFGVPDAVLPITRVAAFYGFGDKLEACFAEVHAANMRKLACPMCDGTSAKHSVRGIHMNCACMDSGVRVRRDTDGKILKPANWQPPNLEPILFGEEA